MVRSKKPGKGKHESDNDRDAIEEQIAAYVDGEMAEDEVIAFEARLAADDGLRREVEQWREAIEASRDWMAEDAPGADRVGSLQIPSLVSGNNVSHTATVVAGPQPLLRRVLAVAAIFAAGFLIGQWTKTGTAPGIAPPVSTPEIVKGSPDKPKETPSPTPPLRQAGPNDEVHPQLAGLSGARYETDDQGRLVIDTNLKASGASIQWVVDSGFRPTGSNSEM